MIWRPDSSAYHVRRAVLAQVDLIIQYDAIGSPIRTTQRSGRTGRKHDGKVIILMTPGYEEKVYEKAQEKEKAMKRAVTAPQWDEFKVAVTALEPVRTGSQTPLSDQANTSVNHSCAAHRSYYSETIASSFPSRAAESASRSDQGSGRAQAREP